LSDQDFGSSLYRIGVVADLLRLSATRDIEKIEPLVHPEMRVVAAVGIAPQAPRPGREGFLDYFRDTEAKGILTEPDAYEIQACLSGKVLVAGSVRFTTDDGTAESPVYYVYAFQNGLISRLETHLGREAAEDAAGTLDL
jgi:hypothetical protein